MTIGNIGMGLATILGIVIVSLVILCFFTMQLWNWHQGKTGTKEIKNTIKNILISFLVGVLTTIILTEVLQARIFFSFFIAAPIGLIVVITVFIYLNRKKIK